MTVSKEICIKLKNRLSELGRLSLVLEELGEALSLPPKTIMDVNLALDEVFTNIVSYGFKDQAEHLVTIHFSVDHEGIAIRVEDDGISFNPLAKPEPHLDVPLEERETGGLGIHLVRNMVDELKYERRRDKNILLLKKKVT